MGLFDFIKDLVLPKHDKPLTDADRQQILLDEVKKAGILIHNFQIHFQSGLATLSGVATTAKDLELARLIVGNHASVNKVNDDELKVAAYPSAQPLVLAPYNEATASAMVKVKKGDTLSAIAQEHLGNASRYQEIFEANRPILKDPDSIFPGQMLRIPKELKGADLREKQKIAKELRTQ